MKDFIFQLLASNLKWNLILYEVKLVTPKKNFIQKFSG